MPGVSLYMLKKSLEPLSANNTETGRYPREGEGGYSGSLLTQFHDTKFSMRNSNFGGGGVYSV